MIAKSFTVDGHHWSGWPGAVCYKCGAPDPDEVALADNKWHIEGEPGSGNEVIVWNDERDKEECERLMECSVKGELKWNTKTKKFDLVNKP